MAPKDFNRRRFLTLWQRAADESSSSVPVSPAPAVATPPTQLRDLRTPLLPLVAPPARPTSSSEQPTLILRPPGAQPERQFVNACERSGHCAKACPAEAILPLTDGTPHIDPSSNPCVVCVGLLCTHACPSGALQPLTMPSEIRMGTASIVTDLCTAYRGLPCRICFEVCPVPEVLIMAKGERAYVPVAGAQPCVGCGVCQHHCPSEGAIRVIPLSSEVPSRVQIAGLVPHLTER